MAEIDEDLLLRFSGPGPRYTSYPTALDWQDGFGDADARAALTRAAEVPGEPLSLYVHLPFCEKRCLFCGCTVEITRDAGRVERYLDALEREIERAAELLGDRRRVVQLHLGGGTPTHLSSDELWRLYTALAARFDFAPGAELSLEVHPRVTTAEQIDTLAELGFNRISLGVQDTDARVQAVTRRDQTVEQTREVVERCRARGFTGINVDLMYGLPLQTEATFAATLATVAELRPDRLAVYGYAHVPWLKPTQRAFSEAQLPDVRLRARLFRIALDVLGAEGYEVIGIDHFALREDALWRSLVDGTLHRNFMGYTTQRAPDTVAFGMSAISDVGGAFLQNARDTRAYEAALESGVLPTTRGLVRSAEDELRRAVVQALMCRMHVDLDELAAAFGRADLSDHFARELAELAAFEREGLCRIEPSRIVVLPKARLFLRHLAMVFDEYRRREQPSGRRFSQTV